MNKLTKEYLESKIESVDFVTHQSNSGKIMRWCILTMKNGFAVTGEPSACIDPKNDNQETGEKIAYENAFNKLWELEGYLLQEKIAEETDNKYYMEKLNAISAKKRAIMDNHPDGLIKPD